MTGYKLMLVVGGQQDWRHNHGFSKKPNPSENRNDNSLWKKSARKVRRFTKTINYEYE